MSLSFETLATIKNLLDEIEKEEIFELYELVEYIIQNSGEYSDRYPSEHFDVSSFGVLVENFSFFTEYLESKRACFAVYSKDE